MPRLNLLLPCLLLCGTFAQAQNLNDFNDVRPLGVLLNPAHIGKEGAKGELGVVYQLYGESEYTPNHFATISYVHHFELKNKDGLNIGLITENQGFTAKVNTMSGGLNAAYIHRFDEKNEISAGTTVNIVQGRRKLFYFAFTNCFEGDCLYADIPETKYAFSYWNLDLGLVWKNKLSENANLSLGVAANNINTPTALYHYKNDNDEDVKTAEVKTYANYTTTLNADFMVSKVVGFAPILMYKTGQSIYLQNEKYTNTFAFGSDIRFKIKTKNEIRLGFLQKLNQEKNSTTYTIGYYNSKIGVGVSHTNFQYKYFNNYYPALQANFQYTF
jgi:hypothetical protein